MRFFFQIELVNDYSHDMKIRLSFMTVGNDKLSFKSLIFAFDSFKLPMTIRENCENSESRSESSSTPPKINNKKAATSSYFSN